MPTPCWMMPHEIIAIRDAGSLAEAYNKAVERTTTDIVIPSHNDVDVLAPDFAVRLSLQLRTFDAVGAVGSTRMDGLRSAGADTRICEAG